MNKTHWKIVGWILSLVIPIATIDNPSLPMLLMTAIVVAYWGIKWKKPLLVVCRAVVGTVAAIGAFAGGQVKKLASVRSTKGGIKVD